MNKVVLVTGASSGIGTKIAQELKKTGFTVYAAARRIDKMDDLRERGIIPVFLDLTNEKSMVDCVQTVLQESGRIDVLINNAGYGSYGPIESVSMEEAKRQFDVNLFGMARLIQLVLPGMRENHCGRIINISSMGGKIWTRFGGWYHATKFAVEGFSDCLRMEVAPFGIDVVVVEPGGIKTDWGVIAANNLKDTAKGSVYETNANNVANSMIKNYSTKSIKIFSLISNIYLVFNIILVLSVIDVHLAKIIDYPELSAISKISVLGFFDRMEDVLSFKFLLDVFITLALCSYYIKCGIKDTNKHQKYNIYIISLIYLIILFISNYIEFNYIYIIISMAIFIITNVLILLKK